MFFCSFWGGAIISRLKGKNRRKRRTTEKRTEKNQNSEDTNPHVIAGVSCNWLWVWIADEERRKRQGKKAHLDLNHKTEARKELVLWGNENYRNQTGLSMCYVKIIYHTIRICATILIFCLNLRMLRTMYTFSVVWKKFKEKNILRFKSSFCKTIVQLVLLISCVLMCDSTTGSVQTPSQLCSRENDRKSRFRVITQIFEINLWIGWSFINFLSYAYLLHIPICQIVRSFSICQ